MKLERIIREHYARKIEAVVAPAVSAQLPRSHGAQSFREGLLFSMAFHAAIAFLCVLCLIRAGDLSPLGERIGKVAADHSFDLYLEGRIADFTRIVQTVRHQGK